jgi:AcrR family transcriptional regulator
MGSQNQISVERAPPQIVITPWGDSGSLRDRQLQPVRGASADEVRRNQRERLFAAIIACVAERGFAATTVEGLVELSGVSRRSFYDNFGDKAECLSGASEELFSIVLNLLEPTEDLSGLEADRLHAYRVLTGVAMMQPAATKVCLSDAFGAGGGAVEALDSGLSDWEKLARRSYDASPEHAGMPDGVIRGRVGGLLEVVRARLRTGRQDELAGLAHDVIDLVVGDRPPPEPLRLSVRTPKAKPESLDAADHSERAIRAFAVLSAERGYPNVKVDDVVRLASMSTTTFYANFAGKEDLLAAALDHACAQAVAAVVPAFNRHSAVPEAIRAGFGALLSFLASRPALARLVTVEVYAAGDAAIEQRIEALGPLRALLENNTTIWSATPPVVFEMIVGGLAHLLHEAVRSDGPESLPGLAPLCTYLTLLPFLGPEQACAAANGDGGGRSAEDKEGPLDQSKPLAAKPGSYDQSMDFASWTLITGLAGRDRTAAELAAETESDERRVVEILNRLTAAGEIEAIGERDGEKLYRAAPVHRLSVASTRQLASMTPSERDQMIAQVWRLIRRELDDAAGSGFLSEHPDSFLTRTPLWVDEEGWRELKRVHERALAASMEIAERNRRRLEESGDQGFEVQSIQIAFEIPESREWLPRPDEPGTG